MQCNHYRCQTPAVEGRKQCDEHLSYARAYQAARREKLLAEGKCARCTGPSRPGRTMCQQCADKWNSYLKTRRTSQ